MFNYSSRRLHPATIPHLPRTSRPMCLEWVPLAPVQDTGRGSSLEGCILRSTDLMSQHKITTMVKYINRSREDVLRVFLAGMRGGFFRDDLIRTNTQIVSWEGWAFRTVNCDRFRTRTKLLAQTTDRMSKQHIQSESIRKPQVEVRCTLEIRGHNQYSRQTT